MDEPSVLDYVKEKLTFWKKGQLSIPPAEEQPEPDLIPPSKRRIEPGLWRRAVLFLPVIFALLAQFFGEPESKSAGAVIFFYCSAVISLSLLAYYKKWQVDSLLQDEGEAGPFTVRWVQFLAGSLVSLLAFALFAGNQFNLINVSFWIIGQALIWWSIWEPENWTEKIRSAWQGFIENGFRVTPWAILVGIVFSLSAFYRFYLLNQVPPEMFSDHAEKLIDVSNLLWGDHAIFFPRNTGREAFQMYLTAAMTKIFGTGISFLSLKLGTCLAGIFSLPFIYLLGKEIKNKQVGLLAMFFAGIAYWPNVISRVALRFALYPAFLAPMLFFLIRGLKRKRWNDFLFSGLFLGLGLHGYSPFRIVPFAVIAILLVYFMHEKSRENRRMAVFALLLVGLISLLVFLPLGRYALSNYDMFSYRMATRMTGAETAIQGSFLEIFFSNLWKSLIMFQWDNGQIWVHSVTGRPALDSISGALFSLGLLLVLIRNLRNFPLKDLVYLALIFPLFILPFSLVPVLLLGIGVVVVVVIFNRLELKWTDLLGGVLLLILLIRPLDLISAISLLLALVLVLYHTRQKWHWVDVALLTSIPVLLLPSVLSIAFPAENPSLNRTGGAIIPVFLIVALAVENLVVNLKEKFPGRWGLWISRTAVLILAIISMRENAGLVFEDYYQQFKNNAWNTSEIGSVIRQFDDTIGDDQQAWVIPYPHWVDTRLVGIQAVGFVKDFALWQSDIQSTIDAPVPKLYIFKPEDEDTSQILRDLFPRGVLDRFESSVEGRDFLLYYVLDDGAGY